MKTSVIFLLLIYLIVCSLAGISVRRSLVSGDDQHTLAKHISLFFTVMTIPISLFQIYEHLSNFWKPLLQVQIIRVIWMVPVFSFESLLSIYFVKYAFLFQVIRETYESYVIYCFLRFLLNYLGDNDILVSRLSSKPAHMGQHKPPFCFLSPWQMGSPFLSGCKIGVLQYVVIRFLLTMISLLLHPLGLYIEGDYSISGSYVWMTLINCLSQSYALYSLFMFYHVWNGEFKGIRPFEKFLSIKLVIFFSWWQGLLIGIPSMIGVFKSILGLLVSFGHIDGIEDNESHTAQEVADGIQDLLISMEMLLAAIAFTYSFSIADFQKNEGRVFLFPSDSSEGSVDDLLDLRPASQIYDSPQLVGSGDLQQTLFVAEQSMGEFSTPREEEDPYTSSSDIETSPISQTSSTFLSKLQAIMIDLISILSTLGKCCGLPSTPYQNSKKKLDRSENLSQYHTRHFHHRQLPHLRSTTLANSHSHVRTRKTTSWSDIQSISEKKPAERRNNRFSFPLVLPIPISMRRQRIGRHKKYSTLQALYLTLLLGELRIDLIELATAVSPQ